MKTIAFALLVAVAACGPRQVEVRTAPVGQATVSLRVTNDLTQAVNVYFVRDGIEQFVKQVGAKSADVVPVAGVGVGTTVTLKAVTADGVRTYTKQNVVLAASTSYAVP